MHKSDRVYFGNTVMYRRRFIFTAGQECVFEQDIPLLHYLSKVYLSKKGAPTGNYNFTYKQFHQPIADITNIINGKYVVQSTKVICTVNYMVEYK